MIKSARLKADVDEWECDQCGAPLPLGSIIYVNDTTGFFCTVDCAKRYEAGYIDRDD